MATINDVARLANVSNATVSHVINKTRKVNPETIEKVEAAIRELGFQPNEQARSLKTGQSRLIGVLNYCSVDPFFSEVLINLEATASKSGYTVLLRHTERDEENQGAAISTWINKNIDGLILNSPVITDDFYELLEKLNCPCVCLHINDPKFKGDTILIDDLKVSEEAIHYLIGLGHKRIACLAGCTYQYHTASQRQTGYQKALTDAGLEIRPDYFMTTFYSIQEGYQATLKLLQQKEPPTAIFAYSDLLAIGAMRAAVDLGFSIPADLSIIGFDDVELASFSNPRLTTISQDKALIGETAVKQILTRIKQPDLPYEKIVLPTRFVVRESTGLARK